MVQMNQFAGQKLRHRCREQRYGHQGGEVAWGGGGVMNWEIGIDIYTVICIKWITNKNLFCKKNKTKFLKKKTSNKMAISTCLSIITLNVKGLNLQSKDIRWRRGLKNKTRSMNMVLTRD